MFTTIVLSTAFMASAALAQSVGKAIVINKCNYQVQLCNTPAAEGGYTQIDQVLEFEDTYEQEWTQLSNGNGWSIKLANSTDFSSNLMQYEYTFHNDGTIWYDLSEVDGNPWDGDWEITSSTSTCTPKQQAYRYATDDAYGMQACPQDAVLTVTLCSGEQANDGAAASASSSVAAESTAAAASSTVYVASATDSSSVYVAPTTSTEVVASTSESPTAAATTFLTTTAYQAPSYTETGWWHQYTWPAGKRDEHVARHAHAARHPHARR